MDVIKRLQEFNLDANTQRLLDYYDSPSYITSVPFLWDTSDKF